MNHECGIIQGQMYQEEGPKEIINRIFKDLDS